MLEKEYEIAHSLATVAHMHQSRWDGSPYILHPRAVAEQFESLHYKIVALLHDVIEDSDHTYHSLLQLGISEEHLDAIQLVTHNSKVSYYDYIHNIKNSGNKYAIAIKIADIKHNSLSLEKYKKFDKRDKYLFALDVLSA